MAPGRKTPFRHMCYHAKFGRSRLNGTGVITEKRIDRLPATSYCWSISMGHGPVSSYRFRGKRRFPSKIANFLTPVYPPPWEFPLELCNSADAALTIMSKMWRYVCVHLDTIPALDGQMIWWNRCILAARAMKSLWQRTVCGIIRTSRRLNVTPKLSTKSPANSG